MQPLIPKGFKKNGDMKKMGYSKRIASENRSGSSMMDMIEKLENRKQEKAEVLNPRAKR